jgi:hypothetical protein
VAVMLMLGLEAGRRRANNKPKGESAVAIKWYQGPHKQGAMGHTSKAPWATQARCHGPHKQGAMGHTGKASWGTQARRHGAHKQGAPHGAPGG